MGLINPVAIAEEQHTISQLISAPLVQRILHQGHQLNYCQVARQETKTRARSNKRAKQRENARNLKSQLSAPLQRSMELSQEKGASSWLAALPIDEHGFALHKSPFRDALSLLDMGGHFRIHLLLAAVATHSLLSMPCLANQEGFRL